MEPSMIERLSDALDAATITLALSARRKPDAVRELVDLLARSGRVSQADQVTREILERERLATTGIGGGIAIPHCLTTSAERTWMAFGRSIPGVKFDAVDRRPVELFFLMVGPPGAHNEHLRLLSRLSRLLHDPGLKESLRTAPTVGHVLTLFADRERS
ncbi:MAG: PTS sugar transporter subunit IIA [Spirochaetaceae bacterium]|nr:MAG: PTS sugar transporter subunit IIA [Spirochaetaceae bacterium]